MNSEQRAKVVASLRDHLSSYRDYRRDAILTAARLQGMPDVTGKGVGFHAIAIAELLDRLDGRVP